MNSKKIIDYSHEFQGAMVAQGRENNILILTRLDKPFVRADGSRASYEVTYRWLSASCENESDQAWACVSGAECTYWQRKEISKLLNKIGKKEVNLFDHFFLN